MSLQQDIRGAPISKRLPDFAGERASGNDVIISPTECTSSRVRQLYDYWTRIRGERIMPKRQDVDPVEIWPLLPYIHLSEWHHQPDGVFFRIAGTELVATAGHEFRGRWLSDILPKEPDLEQIMSLYYRVVATRVPIFGRTDSSEKRLGVEFFEWVLCPLSEDGKNVTHFIGLEDYVSTRRYLGAIPQ
ncbi:MAG TPA: PAS domain-containing protein [Candidatus Binatia bacterium]|nr:PAS domain-containing protein [Candidatus Binatia bacterium]